MYCLENWDMEKVDQRGLPVEEILSKIVHCLVYVNSTEKMLNTAVR